MTAEERTQAFLQGKSVVSVGFHPFARLFCAYATGTPIGEFYTNPEKSLLAQVWVQQMYSHDETTKHGAASFGAWEFGGEVRLPSTEYDQSPVVSRYPVRSDEDAEKLEMPDPKTAGLLPICMEFSKLQHEHDLMTSVLIGSPMILAANILGAENLSRWIMKKPDMVHKILRISTDFAVSVAQYWVDTFGPNNVEPRTATPVESNQLISPKQFEKFGLPYLKELHEKVLGMGVRYIYCHICGEQNKNLPYYEEVPFGDPGIASFGHEVDLDTAIKHLGDKVIIVGNVEPAQILTTSPAKVYEISQKCILKGIKAPRGFALGGGCELPPQAPPVNVWAMRKAINDFGWYS
jgi:uroporphyrinogen decarboxylase